VIDLVEDHVEAVTVNTLVAGCLSARPAIETVDACNRAATVAVHVHRLRLGAALLGTHVFDGKQVSLVATIASRHFLKTFW
jgi:hypothetical protein